MYIVKKVGYVLSRKEENEHLLRKNDAAATLQGHKYYTVLSSAGACDICLAHSGAVYPVEDAEISVNYPPFHPNCKCSVKPFTMSNPFDEPSLDEMISWVEIIHESSSVEEQARKLIAYYGFGGSYSQEFIERLLTATEDTGNVSQRMNEFWRLFELAKEPVIITPAQLKEFGWYVTTQEEADRLTAIFADYGISTWESVREFMALAAAETGYGRDYLENGTDAHFQQHGYDRNTRGAGYLQLTGRRAHLDFLTAMGDNYRGTNTAEYIAENYPLESAIWFWTKKGDYDGGINEFVETRQAKEDDLQLSFLKSAYYTAGFPIGHDEDGNKIQYSVFNNDINDAIAGKVQYVITDDEIIIRRRYYPLPSRWKERFEAYKKAQEIW
jgi:hypothetical protein